MRHIALIGAVLVLASALPSTAAAAWNTTGGSTGSSKAKTMPAGSTPGAVVAGRDVTVTWTAVTLAGGPVIADYLVRRYDATSGALQTIGSSCAGTVSALTCTETSVPPGSWRYSVKPLRAGWTGAESAPSTSVTVGSPALSFTSATTLTTLPATISATTTNFLTGSVLTFRLDDPVSGTILSWAAAGGPAPPSGSTVGGVTIPDPVANGSHTVYAVDGLGAWASAAITVSVDRVAPTVTATAIGKSQGGSAGYLRQGGTYYLYANVVDPGSPATGVASVSANASSVTAGAGAVSLQPGSYSADGVTYNYRSALLTASTPLAEGAYTYSITSADNAGNSAAQTGFSVTVDNTAPTATDVQTTNAGGGTAGKPEAGDTVVFSYSEPVDPVAVLSGWNGASTAVTVRIVDGGLGNDVLQVWNAANSAKLPLGDVDLGRNDFVLANVTFTGSSMAASGNAVTVTLASPSIVLVAVTGTGTLRWTPSSTVTDRAGNACPTASVTESGAADKDF